MKANVLFDCRGFLDEAQLVKCNHMAVVVWHALSELFTLIEGQDKVTLHTEKVIKY